MYSPDDINTLLNGYINSSEGKRAISQAKKDAFNGTSNTQTLLSKTDIIKAGERLKQLLYAAILSSMNSKHFNINGIIVNSPTQDSDGICYLKVSFTDEALHRDSLLGEDSGYTGEGVYDIVGLLTNGYDTDKQVYGYWENQDKWVYSKKHLTAKPFITEAVDQFNIEYTHMGVQVTYPKEWGG